MILLELTFAQELIRELAGAAATAVLVAIAGTVIANRWTAARAERREQFELRRELLDRSQRVGGEFWIKLQHAARTLPVAQKALTAATRRPRLARWRARSCATADRTQADEQHWDALDDSYHRFIVEISALENELGSRYGFDRSIASAEKGSEAFLRCHQVRDLLTMYYFNLRITSGRADRFPDEVREKNSEGFGGEYHAGMDFTTYGLKRSELARMRGVIRPNYEKAMRGLAEALLRDRMSTGASR